jgi:hypothetical protein
MITNDIQSFINIDVNIIIIFLGFSIYILKQYDIKIITNILITAFILAIFDVYLKSILLFDQKDDYYIFIINNIITILVINLFVYLINGMYEKITFERFSYLAFACFFYELIVFKLYNYNNLCNQKLRTMTKTIMRLATVYILSNYLIDGKFDKDWFDISTAGLLNFSLYNLIFE